MFCPNCKEEYRAGFDTCADCGVPLVPEQPGPESKTRKDEIALATVLETCDAGLVAVAKSLLEDADIPFTVRGEHIQDLFGVGRFPGNMNVLVGPVELQVDARDRDEASAVLKALLSDSDGEDTPMGNRED